MNGFQGDSVFMTVRSIDFNNCRISLHTTAKRELEPEVSSLGVVNAGLVIDAPLGTACKGDDAGDWLHLESYARIKQLEESVGLSMPRYPQSCHLTRGLRL